MSPNYNFRLVSNIGAIEFPLWPVVFENFHFREW